MKTSDHSKSRLYEPGDVFAVQLPSGCVGAVRILGRNDERKPYSYLVATTPYLATEPPKLGNQLLSKTLSKKYFSWGGTPALIWYDGPPPESLSYLGNLSLNEIGEEARVDCNTFGGQWKDRVNDEAYRQWRWENDRDAFVAEVQKEQAATLARIKRAQQRQKPKTMLTEEVFWNLIDLLGGPHGGEAALARRLELLTSELSKRTTTQIKHFQESLAYKLFLLDTEAHAVAAKNSDDGFLYARCAVVASGREFYECVLADPGKMPSDREFESLLCVARSAYELKTGEAFEYDTGCSYETGSNTRGWPNE